MFERLTDFSFQRTRKQAIGFYLVWLLAGSILTTIILYTYMRLTGIAPLPKGKAFQENFTAGMAAIQQVGMGVADSIVFLISMTLALLVAKAKNVYNRVTLGCIFLVAVLSLIGALFSFIPVAYLTTLPKSVPQEK